MNIALLIIGIVITIASIIWVVNEKEKTMRHAAPGVLLGLAICVLSQSFAIIPTGYTGVRITFGQIDNRTVQNGFNWKIPFVQKISQVNNKQQDIAYTGQVWSETSERTILYYEGVTVTYTINSEKSAWIYANISDYKKNLISDSLVASAIKSSSKELNSTDATNRGIIEPLAQEKIQEALDQKYGDEVVFINKVVIANTDFEESYNQAIADKQTAQLTYEKQQIENKRQIEAAEAEAQVKTTQAKAEADAVLSLRLPPVFSSPFPKSINCPSSRSLAQNAREGSHTMEARILVSSPSGTSGCSRNRKSLDTSSSTASPKNSIRS